MRPHLKAANHLLHKPSLVPHSFLTFKLSNDYQSDQKQQQTKNCFYLKSAIVGSSAFLSWLSQDEDKNKKPLFLQSIYGNELDWVADKSTNKPTKIEFSQSQFITIVNKKCPEYTLNENGICYALTVLWYVYQHAGKDLLDALKTIETNLKNNIALTNQQKALLNDIRNIQANQNSVLSIHYGEFYSLLNKITVPFIEQFRIKTATVNGMPLDFFFVLEFKNIADKHERELFSQSILQTSLAQPGCLLEIVLKNHNKAGQHVVGLMTYNENDTTVIKYFNANSHEVMFKDLATAQKELPKLLASTQYNEVGNRMEQLQKKYLGLFWDKYGFSKNNDKQIVEQNLVNLHR